MCDVSTGIYAATLVVAAVHQQRRTGVGCALDVAMLDVAVEFLGPMLTSSINADVRYERFPQHHHAIAPYGVFACRDGQIVIAIEQDAEWRRFCELVLDAPDNADRPEYASNLERVARRDEVNALVGSAFAPLSVAEAVALLERGAFAFAELRDVGDVAKHPVLADRGVLTEATAASGAPVTTIHGLAARSFGVTSTRDRPPALGEDQHLLGDSTGARSRRPTR